MESPFFRPSAITAAACTAVQAVAWMVLALLGILTSVEVLGTTIPKNIYDYQNVDFFQLTLVGCYFPTDKWDECCTEDLILRGSGILAVNIVYLVNSFIWLTIAILLLSELLNRGRKIKSLTISWTVITGIVAFLDFIIVILFGVDYANISSKCTKTDALVPLFATGMLLTLSARGFVLWILNVAAAVLIGRAAFRMETVGRKQRRSSDSSGGTEYNYPPDGAQDSRSMVFQKGDRPWELQPRQQQPPLPPTPQSQPPLGAYDPYAAPPKSASVYGGASQPEVLRGGLSARMGQNDSQRGYAPQPQPPAQPHAIQRPSLRTSRIPEPDYDAGQPRSVLKKAPSTAAPRQPQSGRGMQPTPSTSSDPRGAWGPYGNPDNRYGGYDNRGYDNRGWQSDAGGGGGGGWGGSGRTGF